MKKEFFVLWYEHKHTYQYTHSAVGCGTRPVSIGSRRRWAEWTEHVAVASVIFMLGWWVGGGNEASCERVRNCSHVTDRYVSQQCQLRIGRCVRPSALNLFPCYQISCRFDMNERTNLYETFGRKTFLKSSSLFKLAFLFKYFNKFWFNRFGLSPSAFTETSDFISQRNLFKYFFHEFWKIRWSSSIFPLSFLFQIYLDYS